MVELSGKTLPQAFLDRVAKNRQQVALREKDFGIWQRVTWQSYFEHVKWFALGLLELGFRRGDRLSIISENCREWLYADLACVSLGGVSLGVYPTSPYPEVHYVVNHSDSVMAMCEDQEQTDKILEVMDDLPKLKKIIWDDPKGMRNYDQDCLISLKEVQALGKKLDQEKPDLFKELIDKGHGEEVALLFYTSGTTSLPKGALLSHNNMLTMGMHLMAVDPCYDTDDYVSYLPFAWIGEQMMSISCGLQIGYTINFPEEPETSPENRREIGPHVMFAPPRLYEEMTRTVQVKYLDASWLKRKCYEISTKIGYHVANLRFDKKPVPFYWKLLHTIAYAMVQKKLKDHLGLSRVRNAYTGGAAMGPDHFRFFHALGVNLKQIYGQTEVAGISVVHRTGDIKFDTVGHPIPGTEIKITEDGEIITKSPSVFLGYYKNPEATEKTIKDGWLHSDDKGFIDDDGHLVVFDRTKDVFTLRDGRPFSPQYLETRLKFSPYVKDSWVIGDKKDYVTAVLCIDYSVVGLSLIHI